MRKDISLEQYIRDVEQRRLRLDLSRVESADGVPDDFKATTAFHNIVAGIALAKRIEASLALVSGQNGAGKTTALRMYHRGTPGTIYWECRAGYQPRHVLQDIVRELPIRTGEGWRMQTSVTIEYLAENPRIFLLDEAQRLDYASLDLLKYIADNSGSMFVLAASPSLATRIEKWPDIASRCPVRVEVKAMDVKEFVELYQNDGWSLEALEEIHKLSRGIMRTIRAMFLVLDDYRSNVRESNQLEVKRSDFGRQHVRQIATGVVPMQVTGQLARVS